MPRWAVSAFSGRAIQSVLGMIGNLWAGGMALVGFLGLAAVMLPSALFAGRADKITIDRADDSQQSAGEVIQSALGHSGFMVMAIAFFVCGLQLVFITTHLPNYLAICGLDPSLGATALAAPTEEFLLDLAPEAPWRCPEECPRYERRMIDAGADAVVGTHPHVTQDVETYQGKPVFYSLGNFVFDGFTKPSETTGWLLSLEVDKEAVRRWNIHIAHLDAQGTPRPAGCLDQRMNSIKACAVTSGNSSGM